MKDMKKKKLLMMSVIFLSVMAFNLYRVMPDGKNLRAFWLNIEALAEGDDDYFVAVSKACPKNGGQITTGRPYSKQWSEKYTADRNGKVSAAADGKVKRGVSCVMFGVIPGQNKSEWTITYFQFNVDNN